MTKPKRFYKQPLSGLWVKNAEHFHGEQINSHLSISDTCSTVSLSRFFITKSHPEANILENHIKVITQLKKAIGTNYSKNLSDGDQFFHTGWQKMRAFHTGLVES